MINNDNLYEQEFQVIEEQYLSKLPVMYNYLYKMELNLDPNRKEAISVDFYKTSYYSPHKNLKKPISKIVNFDQLYNE